MLFVSEALRGKFGLMTKTSNRRMEKVHAIDLLRRSMIFPLVTFNKIAKTKKLE
jgi:hypothetical protein